MSFMSFVKNNLTKVVVIGVSAIALIVAGTSFIVSAAQYAAYEKAYDKAAEDLKGKFASLPADVFIDDDYVSYDGAEVSGTKSAHTNCVVLGARDATVVPLSKNKAQTYVTIDSDGFTEAISGLDRMGGAISFTVNLDHYSLGDVEIAMMTNWTDGSTYHALGNITDYIKIQINKLDVKTEELELSDSRDEFTHLILQDTNLIEGENTLTITTSAYNNLANKNDFLYVMPNIRNVTFLSDANMEKVVEEVEE